MQDLTVGNHYKVSRPQWDSEQIRALRRHLGLTQGGLADRLGTRQQTISEWEKGMYKPCGASSTLLSIITERAQFDYKAIPSKETPKNVDIIHETVSNKRRNFRGCFAPLTKLSSFLQ